MKSLSQMDHKLTPYILTPVLLNKERSTFSKEGIQTKKSTINLYKSLTIKVHEARITIDVSVFGKMTTYAKIKLGQTIWQTNIDKLSHMNPKWNESKTFDLSEINKIILQRKHQIPNRPHTKDKDLDIDDESKIYITFFHNSFFQDTLVGQIKVKIDELLISKVTSNWFQIQGKNPKENVGAALLTFAFETYEDEFQNPHNFSVKTICDSRGYPNNPEGRCATEPACMPHHADFQSEINDACSVTNNNTKIHTTKNHERSYHSPYLGDKTGYNTTNIMISNMGNTNQRSQGFYNDSHQKLLSSKVNGSGSTEQLHRIPHSIGANINASRKHTVDERDLHSGNTLLTYENDSINEEKQYNNNTNTNPNTNINNIMNPNHNVNNNQNQNPNNNNNNNIDNVNLNHHHHPNNNNNNNNHSKRKSRCDFDGLDFNDIVDNDDDDDDENNYDEEGNIISDNTEGDIDTDQFDEGYKRIRTFEYNKDTDDDISEMQKILEHIKKDNIEIKNKEADLKQKFQNLKNEYDKIMKEKANIDARQNALDMRENCFKNEKKNLSMEFANLKNEQEELKRNLKEIDQLKLTLKQISEEEELQKAQAMLFEEKIKEVSLFIQKENQNIKSLENTMYKTKISNKIEEFNEELLQNHENEDKKQNNILNNITPNEKKKILNIYNIDEQCNLDLLLILLRKKSFRYEEELNKKMLNINRLKAIVDS